MLTFGEVHTGLLQNSTSLPWDATAEVLNLLVGEQVRRSERPMAYAVSPNLLTSVDCRLPAASGKVIRGVGTVVSRASITGGHVAQGSGHTVVVKSTANRRLSWSHYLTRPGTIEAIGKSDATDIARGFAGTTQPMGTLTLGAISGRTLDAVQRSTRLDRHPPFRTQRTHMRWVVTPTDADDAEATGTFRVASPTLRVLELVVPREHIGSIVELCEDLALHDWLLTTLLGLMESSLTGPGTRAQRIARLRPAIDTLLHLWMPAARVDEAVLPVWRSLERRPGFTRQWDASVSRIRDQMTLGTLALLESATA
ncbi:SCO2521 family protein [Asanoa sp. NPDC050611]|uniref:SCO2521 family protein n=1 Tax=Asanoa sp. NPDC050611 TaxID=3157098 RepID=UPI0033C16237